MSADDLLAWMAPRGEVTARQIGDTAPRKFRRNADHTPLLDELLASGRIVEISTWPRAFRVVTDPVPPAKASTGARILTMLDEAIAEWSDLPAGLADYWAAVSVRTKLVERMRVNAGLPAECECCAKAGQAVDEAVTRAFGCEMA